MQNSRSAPKLGGRTRTSLAQRGHSDRRAVGEGVAEAQYRAEEDGRGESGVEARNTALVAADGFRGPPSGSEPNV